MRGTCMKQNVFVLVMVVMLMPMISFAQSPVYCTTEKPCQVQWDANTEPDMSHYNFYWGSATRTYDGAGAPFRVDHPSTQIQDLVTNLALNDGVYFLAVTAVDLAGNESDFSNELSMIVDTQAPGTPTITIVIP